jgi:hypothetical protein
VPGCCAFCSLGVWRAQGGEREGIPRRAQQPPEIYIPKATEPRRRPRQKLLRRSWHRFVDAASRAHAAYQAGWPHAHAWLSCGSAPPKHALDSADTCPDSVQPKQTACTSCGQSGACYPVCVCVCGSERIAAPALGVAAFNISIRWQGKNACRTACRVQVHTKQGSVRTHRGVRHAHNQGCSGKRPGGGWLVRCGGRGRASAPASTKRGPDVEGI